jgi:hypothetical protein
MIFKVYFALPVQFFGLLAGLLTFYLISGNIGNYQNIY